eukprot:303879-Rhodomonas_salina.1
MLEVWAVSVVVSLLSDRESACCWREEALEERDDLHKLWPLDEDLALRLDHGSLPVAQIFRCTQLDLHAPRRVVGAGREQPLHPRPGVQLRATATRVSFSTFRTRNPLSGQVSQHPLLPRWGVSPQHESGCAGLSADGAAAKHRALVVCLLHT